MESNKLYTPAFLVLCLSYTLFSASFNMILPELPAYLSSLGGAEYKGLIISLFTLTAGLSRPISGKLADLIGRKPVIFFGISVCIVCSLFYPILTTVWAFLLLRLVHGFSTGFSPTATVAYVADITPIQRRGEAIGIISVCMNVGASIAPPFGSFIAVQFSLSTMFMASSMAALVSFLVLLGLKETLVERQRFQVQFLRINRNEIIERSAIFPALICLLTYAGFGAILTIMPDRAVYLEMSNKGLFFTFITAFSILSRLIAGRLSDQFGRVPVMKVGVALLVVSTWLLGESDSTTWLFFASSFFGFSAGIVGPAIFAWSIDRTKDDRRGRALGTVFIGLEIGIGFGALASAFIFDNNHDNFAWAFRLIAAMNLIALLLLLFNDR